MKSRAACTRAVIALLPGVLATLAVAGSSDAALTQSGTAAVSFSALGPAGMTINGTTPDLRVAESTGDIGITVPLARLTTGIALRDDHMRNKYLEVATYPEAVLHVARAALVFPAQAPTSSSVVGALTLHGVTRNVTIAYSAQRGADGTYSVAGKTALDMRDYNITVPSYLGVAVKPNVTLDVRFVAKE
jgi:polyisoprenoid-binding protein YceI